MNFLDSSAVWIPALTGMALTLYEETLDTLNQFECQYCFSPQLQKIYTAQGLDAFFQENGEEHIYDLAESMGTRLIAFKHEGLWILLGPYVETGWSERASRLLLARQGASEAVLPMYKAYRCKLPIVTHEFAVKTAFLLSEHLSSKIRTLETFRFEPAGRSSALTFSDLYTNAQEVNRRYQIEDLFIEAIGQGDAGKAHRTWKEFDMVNTDIRFISDSMQDQLVGAAIVRTLIRIGAKQGGLSPVLIDSISQEYAQRMKHTSSKTELRGLMAEMSSRLCDEIRERQRYGWSSPVRRAADYMEVNLSKSMTTAEIARAAGEKKRSFVNRFLQETGMTVKEYLAKTRCQIAAQLLTDSEASIQDIAAYVGYPDNNYFSKVFKANLGISPQSYRSVHKTS